MRANAPTPEPGVHPAARPAEQTRDQQTLRRILASEHNAYPAPLDQQAQERTLAREHHTDDPAATDSRQSANTGPAAQRWTISTLAVVAMTAALAMTWRRRARYRLRKAA